VCRDTKRSFQFDTTTGSSTIEMLNTSDEFTRECPAIESTAPSTPTESRRLGL
jgi:hypothetical protein